MKLFLYLAGPDGSGKTTHMESVVKQFQSQNIVLKHIWIRSPKILSKPLMVYCRLAGLTRYKLINGLKVGKHEFYKSNTISQIFPYIQLFDMMITNFILLKIPMLFKKRNIIFDRFALDTLADLMVDTKRYNLHETWVGKKFITMIPENTKIIILDIDEKTARKRKNDVEHDPLLLDKIQVYQILAKDLQIKTINNNKPFNVVEKEIGDWFNK